MFTVTSTECRATSNRGPRIIKIPFFYRDTAFSHGENWPPSMVHNICRTPCEHFHTVLISARLLQVRTNKLSQIQSKSGAAKSTASRSSIHLTEALEGTQYFHIQPQDFPYLVQHRKLVIAASCENVTNGHYQGCFQSLRNKNIFQNYEILDL